MQILSSSKAVENIELGQGDAVDARGLDRLPRQHGVEPAAAPAPAGVGAEFAPAIADRVADLVVEFGRKRAAADAGRIGLGDAQHIADRAGPEPRAARRRRRDGVRGGHIRIGAVIDIEQRALRALEQDALAGAPVRVEQRPHRVHDRARCAARRRAILRATPPGRSRAGPGRAASGSWCASTRAILSSSVSGSARSISRIERRPTLSS